MWALKGLNTVAPSSFNTGSPLGPKTEVPVSCYTVAPLAVIQKFP